VNLQHYKALIILVTSVLALLVASPTLQRLLIYPQPENFSAIWLLDSESQAERFPFNLKSGTSYNLHLGIENNLGSCAYYQVRVKFRNLTQSVPNNHNLAASSLPSLYNLAYFVPDKENLTFPLTFSFNYTPQLNSDNASFSKVTFNYLLLNGIPLNLDGYSTSWDSERNGFPSNLFFELWIYNGTTGIFQYHERYTSLFFNMTI
jgi:hypothetical protein